MTTHGSSQSAAPAQSIRSVKLLLVGAQPAAVVRLTESQIHSGLPVSSATLARTATNALEMLAEESFDCILVLNSTGDLTQPGIDARAFCAATRAAGCLDAILVLTFRASDALWKIACETESDLYVGAIDWGSPTLFMLIDRAIQQRNLARESQRRQWAADQRGDRERDECTNLLRQQRQLLAEAPAEQFGGLEAILPPELSLVYRELLRTYVTTGTISLAVEIKKLAQTFAVANLTPRQVVQLHLDQLEHLVNGIGQRSARHILDRANVLCVELLVSVCELANEQNARTWWAWRRRPVSDAGLPLERRAA